ncbi:MAG TPA: serine/threonine-protein kinase [Thermoanaerobaculia bacterium]|nr:serine/threonine-protein kinase [Thermoanaerobaculia bacterium]
METASAVPTKIGKYEVLGVIGRGGMGVVYKARDPFIDRIVAVKTIRIDSDAEDDQVGRLRMEARSAGKLHHPNIVTIYDFGEEESLSYIVMECVEGINLSRVINAKVTIPLSARLPIVLQIGRGLAYAHESGVVHRDMKPSNVCVTSRGVPKILDFGLARFDNTRLTKTGYLSGTIAYMSPERFSGDTGPQDDIFALGAVAYEFLTYRRAFPGDTTPEIISKILGGPMPPLVSTLTGYPAELDDVIMKALARDPADRYTSAADFVADIETFARSESCLAYMAAEPQSEPFNWMEGDLPASLNPYSSGRSMPSGAMEESPTLRLASESGEAGATEVVRPPADPTLAKTRARPEVQRAEQTVIVPEEPVRTKRAPFAAIAAVALVVIAGVAFLVARNRQPAQQQPRPAKATLPATTVTTVTASAQNDAASRESDVQLATATTLAGLVAQRHLTPDERVRYDDANRQLENARARIADKDYAGGAALASQASQTLRDLLSSNGVPAVATTTAAASPGKPIRPPKGPVIAHTETEAPPPVAVLTQTTVVTPSPAPVQPATVTTAPAPPPKPSRADLEREIHTFMREIAMAYQDKNVGFFRQRAMNFTDQLASAIRNSPSTRVDIVVKSIQFTDEGDATVAVRRTDTFAESGTPPGVQNLVYELKRTPDGWKIVRFSRTAA